MRRASSLRDQKVHFRSRVATKHEIACLCVPLPSKSPQSGRPPHGSVSQSCSRTRDYFLDNLPITTTSRTTTSTPMTVQSHPHPSAHPSARRTHHGASSVARRPARHWGIQTVSGGSIGVRIGAIRRWRPLVATNRRENASTGYRLVLRSSCALRATTTVLSDIRIAPTAGCNTIPHGASTPAASGMATML